MLKLLFKTRLNGLFKNGMKKWSGMKNAKPRNNNKMTQSHAILFNRKRESPQEPQAVLKQ